MLEAPRVLKTGMPVDDALGGGVELGKLSVIGGAHEDVSNVLVHAALRLSEQCAVLYVPIREREEDAIARLIRAEMDDKVSEDPEEQQVETIRATMRLKQRNLGIFAEDNMTMDLLTSWLLGDQTWNRAVLKDAVVVIDGLEMLDDNRPVNAILRDLRNMLSPTAAILAGCFAVEDRDNDAAFAETHCNADALVRISSDGMEPSCTRASAEVIANNNCSASSASTSRK